MSFPNSSVDNPEYRSFVSEGFMDLFDDGLKEDPYVANYLADLDNTWQQLPTLFDGSERNEDREFHPLSIFFALGYCVGWMDSENNLVCDLSIPESNFSRFAVPSEIGRIARDWISAGPVLVRPAFEVLRPYDPWFVAEQGFYRGYMGGIETHTQEVVLAVGVH